MVPLIGHSLWTQGFAHVRPGGLPFAPGLSRLGSALLYPQAEVAQLALSGQDTRQP